MKINGPLSGLNPNEFPPRAADSVRRAFGEGLKSERVYQTRDGLELIDSSLEGVSYGLHELEVELEGCGHVQLPALVINSVRSRCHADSTLYCPNQT
jgi:hypothetical protein